MMKRLEKHFFMEFLKLLILTTAGFIVVFILVDLFENMDNLIKFHVPLVDVIAFFIYRIPFILGQVTPIAALVSVLLSTGMLSMSGEITAVRASGVRLLRVFVPIFAAGFIISIGVIFINEYLTPLGLKKTEDFKVQWFGKTSRGSYGSKGLWLRTRDSIINIRDMEPGGKTIRGITIYRISRPFRLKRRIDARSARWNGNEWTGRRVLVRDFRPDGSLIEKEPARMKLAGLAPPEDLTEQERGHLSMTMGELRGLIKILESEGYNTYQYRTDLYARVAFPFVTFIMVLLGVPFPLRGARTGGIASGIGLSILIAFSFWIIFALSTSLGAGGMVPPLVAAIFPDILFLATAGWLLAHVKE